MAFINSKAKLRIGTVCVYPDCGKPVSTTHFKDHFVREHLGGDANLYHSSHRKYEVVRTDPTLLDSQEGIKSFLISAIQLQNNKIDMIYKMTEKTFEIVKTLSGYQSDSPSIDQSVAQSTHSSSVSSNRTYIASPPSYTMSPPRTLPSTPPQSPTPTPTPPRSPTTPRAPPRSSTPLPPSPIRSPRTPRTPTFRPIPIRSPLANPKRSRVEEEQATESDSSTDEQPRPKRVKRTQSKATINEDGSLTVNNFTFDKDIVEGWRNATRTPLTPEELQELKERADAVEKTLTSSKKKKTLSYENVLEIITIHLQTDAKQGLIARLTGTTQSTVSNYCRWVSTALSP